MSSATGGLKELHQVHLDLDACRKQLDNGPRRIAAHEKLVARKQAEIDAQKSQIIGFQKTADQKHLQFQTNEQHVEDTKAKLNQAKSNKEFDIFKGQIAADEKANAGLEDDYLELLEQVDTEKSRLAEPQVKTQASELEGELREAEKCIPTKMQEFYRRLVGAHGPSSLAPLDANACSECFVELSPQNIVEVRTAKLVLCKSCGRILYSAEAE
jgi:predicted  nucleic acid-binding Zn-ribbon protein